MGTVLQNFTAERCGSLRLPSPSGAIHLQQMPKQLTCKSCSHTWTAVRMCSGMHGSQLVTRQMTRMVEAICWRRMDLQLLPKWVKSTGTLLTHIHLSSETLFMHLSV